MYTYQKDKPYIFRETGKGEIIIVVGRYATIRSTHEKYTVQFTACKYEM